MIDDIIYQFLIHSLPPLWSLTMKYTCLIRTLLRVLFGIILFAAALGAAANQPVQASPAGDGWIPFTPGAQPGSLPAVRLLHATDSSLSLLAEIPGVQSLSLIHISEPTRPY